MKSIFSIFMVLMLIITIMWGMSGIGTEITGNSNLDTASVNLINNVTNILENDFNPDANFDAAVKNLSGEDAKFDDEDVFAREFLEGKSEGNVQEQRTTSITKLPDLMILVMGVPEQDLFIYKLIAGLILVMFGVIAGFRVFFGGGKITDN